MSVTGPPAVVTTTLAGPAVPDGAVTVIEVDVSAVTVAAVPPMVTVAASRFDPAIATVLPAASGPELGVTVVTTGAASKVYPPVTVTVTAPGKCATTSAGPAVPEGAVTVMLVEVATTLVAGVPPIVTEVAVARLEPLITTVFPPPRGPASGMTDVIAGPAR